MNNKPWKNDSFHSSYDEADQKRKKLLSLWEGNSTHEGMQVKVKYLSSRNSFVVKTRLHPDFEEKKSKKKKNVKNNRKNKKNNETGKFDLATTS